MIPEWEDHRVISMFDRFTFGVFAYKQESEVTLTLDSILYQINEYGQDIECKLVITDDCSPDNTVAVIEQWLEEHACSFHQVVRRYNTENKELLTTFFLSWIRFVTSHLRL